MAADWGGESCFFHQVEERLKVSLPAWGALDLIRTGPFEFRSTPPSDSAGEFQIRLSWVLSLDAWDWHFSTGLQGTKTKGAELSWHLRRSVSSTT